MKRGEMRIIPLSDVAVTGPPVAYEGDGVLASVVGHNKPVFIYTLVISRTGELGLSRRKGRLLQRPTHTGWVTFIETVRSPKFARPEKLITTPLPVSRRDWITDLKLYNLYDKQPDEILDAIAHAVMTADR